MTAGSDYAMAISHHGGPDVLQRHEIDLGAPGPGEVLLHQHAVGLNFVDIYHRQGQFGAHEPIPMPAVLGVQGAGLVEAVGEGVTTLQPGDRVGYVGANGAYASRRLIPAGKLVALPDDIDFDFAAATLVRGLTAEYLLFQLHPVQKGETILIHAAAGGVGSIVARWARSLGATVIGTVSTPEKVARAQEAGCHHVLVYPQQDWVAATLEITGGKGVPVVYDSIGRDTFLKSLKCLGVRGLAINFGTTSGQVEDFPLQLLHSKSLSVCRPTLPNFVADPVAYKKATDRFFSAVRSGVLDLSIAHRYRLADVATAHADFEARRITGLPVLIP